MNAVYCNIVRSPSDFHLSLSQSIKDDYRQSNLNYQRLLIDFTHLYNHGTNSVLNINSIISQYLTISSLSLSHLVRSLSRIPAVSSFSLNLFSSVLFHLLHMCDTPTRSCTVWETQCGTKWWGYSSIGLKHALPYEWFVRLNLPFEPNQFQHLFFFIIHITFLMVIQSGKFQYFIS